MYCVQARSLSTTVAHAPGGAHKVAAAADVAAQLPTPPPTPHPYLPPSPSLDTMPSPPDAAASAQEPPAKRIRRPVVLPGMTSSATMDLRTTDLRARVRRMASRLPLASSAQAAAVAAIREGAQPSADPQPGTEERVQPAASPQLDPAAADSAFRFIQQSLENFVEEMEAVVSLVQSALVYTKGDIIAFLDAYNKAAVPATAAAVSTATPIHVPTVLQTTVDLLAEESNLASIVEGESESGGPAAGASAYVDVREAQETGQGAEPFMLSVLGDSDDSDKENVDPNRPPPARASVSELQSVNTTVPAAHIPPPVTFFTGLSAVDNLSIHMAVMVTHTIGVAEIYMDAAVPRVEDRQRKLFQYVIKDYYFTNVLQAKLCAATEAHNITAHLVPHFTRIERLPGGSFVMRVLGALLYCFNTYMRHAENAAAGRCYVIEWSRDGRAIYNIIFEK